MMKKIFALLLVCVMALGLFSACGKVDPAKDVENIKKAKELVVGITDFAPMDYHPNEGSTEWVGFDADMAKEFAKYLGVEVKFVEIEWDNKALELENGSIDVVWNGMTITDEVKGSMDVSIPYCNNKQVVVVKAEMAESIKTTEDLKALTFAVEAGSAGEKAINAVGVKAVNSVGTQADALLEVSSGASQACVIDLLMAGAMIGEGTDYENLVSTISLTEEEYGVGFRKESNLVAEFNKFWKAAYKDGTVLETAEEYGVAQNMIDPEAN